MTFKIAPPTFVPGVTSSVNMRCDVLQSGNELSQLLLLQLEVMDRGNMVPVVTLTPGGGPHIEEVGAAAKITVSLQTGQYKKSKISWGKKNQMAS